MSTPPPQPGPQQPPYYPEQQYQQPPPTGPAPPYYGAPPPKPKSKLPIIIVIVVVVVVVVVVLAILLMGMGKPSSMTATQLLDDYDVASFNYRSYDSGDTITIRDKIDSIDDFGGNTYITFDYTGSDSYWQYSDLEVPVSGDIGSCREGDTISIKATVGSLLGMEIPPSGLDWQVVDTSGC